MTTTTYTITINDITHPLDTDEGRFVWPSMPPPLCICGSTLGAFCDDKTRQVSIHSYWHDDHAVECDNCGARYAIIKERVK